MLNGLFSVLVFSSDTLFTCLGGAALSSSGRKEEQGGELSASKSPLPPYVEKKGT